MKISFCEQYRCRNLTGPGRVDPKNYVPQPHAVLGLLRRVRGAMAVAVEINICSTHLTGSRLPYAQHATWSA